MPRQRIIKPETWSDDSLSECSVSARLLFIGTWNFSDDYGNLDRSARQLKSQVFPSDEDIFVADVEKMIIELLTHGLLIEYSVNGKKYLHIKGFTKHQTINRPSKPSIPAYDDSLRTHTLLTEDSVSTHDEKKRKEVKRSEEKGKEEKFDSEPKGSSVCVINGVVNNSLTTKPNTVQGLDSPASSIASGLFQFWREVMNHPRAKLGEKSTKLIRDRVKEGFSEDDLRLAIVGCSRTPHNMGDNQQRTVYDDFDLIFRDSAHVRRFIKSSELPPFNPALIGVSQNEREFIEAGQRFLDRGAPKQPEKEVEVVEEEPVLQLEQEEDDGPY